MKRSLFALMLVALLAGASVPAFAQDDPCFDVGGLIDAATGACVQHAALDIHSVYPLEAAQLSAAMAGAIDDFINGSYAEFMSNFPVTGFLPGSGNPWALDLQPEILQGISTTSVVFTRYTYTGGANGTTDYHTLTATLPAGDLLTLEELFVVDVNPYATLQPLAEAALIAQLGDAAFPDMMALGLEPVPENYQNWALTETSLNLYFNKYQVAPGAAGAPVIAIPLSDLSDVLQTKYLP